MGEFEVSKDESKVSEVVIDLEHVKKRHALRDELFPCAHDYGTLHNVWLRDMSWLIREYEKLIKERDYLLVERDNINRK